MTFTNLLAFRVEPLTLNKLILTGGGGIFQGGELVLCIKY